MAAPTTSWDSRLIGVHCSTVGGLAKAIERGAALGCSAIQIFAKNNSRWKTPPLRDKDLHEFFEARRTSGIKLVCAHIGYLINLASGQRSIVEQSMESMRLEFRLAEQLEIPVLILRPGSHTGDGELVGIRRLADRLNILLDETYYSDLRIMIENSAGQGSSLGHRFEHLRDLLDRLHDRRRVRICLDTAHLFAAGYDLRTPTTYEATWQVFDQIVGRSWLGCLHVNDSARALNSHVDRHEHLGKGKIGIRAFGLLMRDPQLSHVPMILEPPKGGKGGLVDQKNLQTLRRLLRG